jgi:ADP-ribose pyrophosphatase YjhB (NUDIX family)
MSTTGCPPRSPRVCRGRGRTGGHTRRMDQITFLERIRGLAQLGLTYATDPYDKARYHELLALAAAGYEPFTGVPSAEIIDRFAREVGYITPKVGVDGAVFSPDGTELLVIRRADNGRWALPGGWADLGQTAAESVARELREETLLEVTVGDVINVDTVLAGTTDGPHTAVHVTYHCTVTAGRPCPTPEAVEVAFRRPAEVADWQANHDRWAAAAIAWRQRKASP